MATLKETQKSATELTLDPNTFADYKHHKAQIARLAQVEGWEKMLSHCKAAIRLNPADWSSYLAMGDALLGLERWSESVDLFQRVVVRSPNQTTAYRKLAIALAALGRLQESDENYARFLEQVPDFEQQDMYDFVAQRQAGDFFFRRNRFKEAIAAYRKAVAIEPSDCWAQINLGRLLLQTGQIDSAKTILRRSISLDSSNSVAYYHLAQLLLDEREYSQAQRLCQKALVLHPDNSLIHSLLAQVTAALAQQKTAASMTVDRLEKPTKREWVSPVSDCEGTLVVDAPLPTDAAASTNPFEEGSFQYYDHIGKTQLTAGRTREAIAAYERAIALNPDFLLSQYGLAQALARIERYAEACQAYQKALTLQHLPTVVDQFNQARWQQQQQQPTAVQKALQAVSKNPYDPARHVALADAYYRYSYVEDAISYYQIAQDLCLDNCLEIAQKLTLAGDRKNRLEAAFHHPVVISADYAAWVIENAPSPEQLIIMPARVDSFKLKPVISIVVPVYNPPEDVLREMIQSVVDQTYPYWELCLADDCSTAPYVKSVLKEFAQLDSRIKPIFRAENGHISAASNSALAIATGEYIGLLDHDDKLTPDALFETVLLINQHPEADMIYSDEDKLTAAGERIDPAFKPDWAPDSFLSRMYVCHFGVYRKAIVDKIGGFRLGFEGSQDYDLVLRFVEHTDHIFHIPKILYHWRMLATSTASRTDVKSYARDAACIAIEEAMARRGEPGKVQLSELPGVYIPRYDLKAESLISIIIPTRNYGSVLDVCLASVFEKSTYQNFEVILIDNGSDEPETIEIIESWKKKEPNRLLSYVYDIPFNFSNINNYAVTKARGDYLLFLNNDVELITPDWLEAMLEQAQRSSVGAVGAKLFYPDNTLQHGGVIVGLGGVAGHSHKHLPRDHHGYCRQAIAVNNYSAVTAACLMCQRKVFEAVGGFEDHLQVAFNDIDLCLKIQAAGYRNVWLPHVHLYHFESKSRGYEDNPEKIKRFQTEIEYMRSRWAETIERDPYYSPNLTRDREDYSIRSAVCGKVTALTHYYRDSSCILAASIDSPQVGVCGAVVVVSGWIIGRESSAAAVTLEQLGEVITTVSVDFPRPDVDAAYPNVSNIESCGFQAPLHILSLSEDASVIATVHFEDGRSFSLCEMEIQSSFKHRISENAPPKSVAQEAISSEEIYTSNVLEVVQVPLSAKLAGCAVDTPIPGEYTNVLTVTGWIVSKDCSVEKIIAFDPLNEESLIEIAVGRTRPDVTEIFSEFPFSERPGFELKLDVESLLNTPQVNLQALLSSQDVVEIGAIKLS